LRFSIPEVYPHFQHRSTTTYPGPVREPLKRAVVKRFACVVNSRSRSVHQQVLYQSCN
jgi:hypothetical protein